MSRLKSKDSADYTLFWRVRSCLPSLWRQISFIYQALNDFNYDKQWICNSASAFLLTVALGIVFWHLTALNKKVEGVFCNSNLMLLHFLTFFCAATCDIIVGIVQSVNTKLLNEHDQI